MPRSRRQTAEQKPGAQQATNSATQLYYCVKFLKINIIKLFLDFLYKTNMRTSFYLGITITFDSKLTFDEHIGQVVNKATKISIPIYR